MLGYHNAMTQDEFNAHNDLLNQMYFFGLKNNPDKPKFLREIMGGNHGVKREPDLKDKVNELMFAHKSLSSL